MTVNPSSPASLTPCATDGNVRVYYSYGNHHIDDPRHIHSLDDRFVVMVHQVFRPWEGANDNVTATRYAINRGYEMLRCTAMGGFKLRFSII